MCVARAQPKTMLEQDSGIHTGEDGDMAAGPNREIAQVEAAREDFISGQKFVGYGQSALLDG